MHLTLTENTVGNINLSSLFNSWIFAFLWGQFKSHDKWSSDPTYNNSASFFASTEAFTLCSEPGQHILYPLGSGMLVSTQLSPSGKPTDSVALPGSSRCSCRMLCPLLWVLLLSAEHLLWNNHLSHRQKEKLQTHSKVILLDALT